MNFLAHAYLSYGDKEILIGNMIADFVKGNRKNDYPERIKKGIEIHRRIDEFTDHHLGTTSAKKKFSAAYGHYSGVFTDVVFDHYLATDSRYFSKESLTGFASNVYLVMDENRHFIPEKYAFVFDRMKQQNWLLNYYETWGAEKSIHGITMRAKYLDQSETAIHLFGKHYHELRSDFELLFPDLEKFVKDLLFTD